ncbi:MAG: hypothetical protein NVS1B11_16560 [Terriglobales bacterium]
MNADFDSEKTSRGYGPISHFEPVLELQLFYLLLGAQYMHDRHSSDTKVSSDVCQPQGKMRHPNLRRGPQLTSTILNKLC